MIHVHGWDISQQMVMTGAVVGLSYSAIAAGLILVYRANGIINFAVVAFGAVALGAVRRAHRARLGPVAVPARRGARSPRSLAMLLEVVVIRRLADAPRLVLLMATIGIAQLLGFAVLVFAELLPDVPPGRRLPHARAHGTGAGRSPKDLLIGAREISVLIAVPILVILLALFMTRTRLGLMVRAAASNPEKSRLDGHPGGAHVDGGLGHRRRVHRGHDHRARGGAVRDAAGRGERHRAAHARLSRCSSRRC